MSEKFASELAETLWELSLDSSQDETLGTAEGFGWFALFTEERAILHVDSVGFVTAVQYPMPDAAQIAWTALEASHARYEMAGIREALPLGECEEIFLIFDTARHAESVPEYGDVADHIRACDVCGPYAYVLDL